MLAFPLKMPGSRLFKGLRARGRIISALKKMINMRREGMEYHEDFLQSLLIRDGDNSSDSTLTDSEIQDNMLTLIIAESFLLWWNWCTRSYVILISRIDFPLVKGKRTTANSRPNAEEMNPKFLLMHGQSEEDTSYMVFILRAGGILLSFYVIMSVVKGIQEVQRLQLQQRLHSEVSTRSRE